MKKRLSSVTRLEEQRCRLQKSKEINQKHPRTFLSERRIWRAAKKSGTFSSRVKSSVCSFRPIIIDEDIPVEASSWIPLKKHSVLTSSNHGATRDIDNDTFWFGSLKTRERESLETFACFGVQPHYTSCSSLSLSSPGKRCRNWLGRDPWNISDWSQQSDGWGGSAQKLIQSECLLWKVPTANSDADISGSSKSERRADRILHPVN